MSKPIFCTIRPHYISSNKCRHQFFINEATSGSQMLNLFIVKYNVALKGTRAQTCGRILEIKYSN